jgi:LDH2 family malate/lactate/ureidoglycolate dehydrogenase
MDSSSTIKYSIIAKDEMEDFFYRCMLTLGTKESHAKVLANCLITADYRGHFSHGLNKLCECFFLV